MHTGRLAPLCTLARVCVAAATAVTGLGCSELSGVTALAGDGDQQLSKRSLLTLRDFPAGWEQAEQPVPPAKCPAFSAARRRASGVASALRFTHGTDTQVAATVYRFPDEATAEREFRSINGRGARRCYREAIAKSLEDTTQVKVGRARIRRLALDRVGDQRTASRFILPLSMSGAVGADLFVDLTCVRTGRGISVVILLNLSSAFDTALRRDLVARQAGRLAA
jgi:hypothetical protein